MKCVHVIRQSMYYHTASEKLGSESENASAVLFSPFQTVSKSFLHEISTAKKKKRFESILIYHLHFVTACQTDSI